jgi:hypothetical protein
MRRNAVSVESLRRGPFHDHPLETRILNPELAITLDLTIWDVYHCAAGWPSLGR